MFRRFHIKEFRSFVRPKKNRPNDVRRNLKNKKENHRVENVPHIPKLNQNTFFIVLMNFKQLCFVLQTYSPDTVLKGLPLLYWTLKKPECVALLLQQGANPDIRCHVAEDLNVSPLYAVQNGLRISKRREKSELVRELLEWHGATAIRYSDFCVVNIQPRAKIQPRTNEIML